MGTTSAAGSGTGWIARCTRCLPSLAAEAALGPGWRLFWVKAVLACGLLSGLLLSPRLWPSSRAYPLSPISALLPKVPAPLDWLWFGTLLVLLVGIALTRHSRGLILLFVCLAGLLSLWDQSRWQPWFYQYLFLLAAFVFCSAPHGPAGAEQPVAILNNARFILSATYVWSGLQKCNVSFLSDVYPWLLEPLLPKPAPQLVLAVGVGVPVLETALGLGLLVPALRRIAVLLVLAMHAALLFCLGPWGHNWNSVVWPWNLAMMALAVLLFWRTRAVSFRAIVWPGASVYRWLVLLLFGIMPGFNFVGLWDSYLSAALYSGNLIEADIALSATVYQRSPREIQRYCQWCGDHYEVDVDTWSMEELNVPPYPARRVYRRIARSFCAWRKCPRTSSW